MPEDVLMEILSRIPIKFLLRFKSVSKYWYALIQSPVFISLHRNRAESKDFLLVTRQTLCGGQLEDDTVFSMFLVPNQTSPIEDLDLSFAGLHDGDDVKGVFFLGCHNGVMCLANDITSTIVIFNPAMRESRVLPQPLYETKHRSNLGFTFDPKANDYKVIRFCSILEFMPFSTFYDEYDVPYGHESLLDYDNYCGDQKVQIYDLSTDSWRETEAVVPKDFPDGSEARGCTSLDGVFYWFGLDFGTGVWGLSVFRTFEGVFERITLPDGICFICDRQLRVLHDSLALVLCMWDNPEGETRIDIWIMDDNGVNEGWTKRYRIGPFLECHSVLGFLPNFELRLNFDDREMVSYNLRTHEIKEYNSQLCDRMELWSVDVQVFQYAESLISVKRRVD
ncbi:hypothetical protein Vadar_027390 [Vaccinium darrowii]|uniref:Uncharacterized protein n=1 Tax=Vaccinium darrowii TaxID=229202 RepID=A0ACB7Y2Y1_9ERIC|nr:hypothetical protein Vadar_027390 [Vaccinium darrowii]